MKHYPVIGIVGPQASGKTVVASKLSDLGASRVRMGDIAWEKVEERRLEVTEENVARIANELREEEGMGAMAKYSIPHIKNEMKNNSAVVVDGIRGISEVKKFKEKFGKDFVLISIEASEETRYERIKKREREDDIKNFEAFQRKDNREKKWGLKEAMESADYKITNEDSLEKLKEKTSSIFEEIMKKYEN